MARTAKSKKAAGILDGLSPIGGFQQEDLRPVLYKIVDTFSGIVQRKLFLKHDEDGPARTDGRCITVDLNGEDVYCKVEHELSHVLFQSDPIAKSKFVEEYQGRILTFAEAQKVKLSKRVVADLLDFVINIIEDRRVDSLWATLYPGSAALQRELHFKIVQSFAERAHDSFLLYFACVEAEVPTAPGPLDRFRPVFQEALAKVERKGFLATLALAKWVVTSLVNQIIGQSVEMSKSDDSDSAQGSDSSGEGNGSGQGAEQGSEEDAAEASTASDSAASTPPPAEPRSTAQVRAKAFSVLASKSAVPVELRIDKSDLVIPEYKERDADRKAQQLVSAALQADLGSASALAELLESTAAEMEQIATKARQAIKAPVSQDDWIRKDSMAKVNFHDISKDDLTSIKPFDASDLDAVRRLRALFTRTIGKRRTVLDDSGTEIDIGALIERRLSNQPIPCFKREENGRGFRSLVLLDRSSSMQGLRSNQAERACRIINRALKFPFAATDTWGFQSLENGNVDISRFERNLDGFTSPKSKVDGSTPLHTAIRLATRYLEQGTETKQLIVITDGEPHYITKSGARVPMAQLYEWVRKEVLHARKRGINVTCLMIGATVPAAKLRFMFGHQSNWKVVDESRLGSDLVNLVSTSFVKYLSTR